MSTQKYTNLAKTTLASNYTAGDSTISVADASHFPSSGDFMVAIDDPTSFFLKVTAISGTTLTVSTTAQEGYGSLSNKSTGTKVTAVLTAGMLDSIRADMLTAGAAGSLPATTGQTAGNLYRCTDAPMVFQFNGTIWAPWGPLYPFTLPKLSDFTADGSQTATVTDTGAGITVTGSNNGVGFYRMAVGSTPFTVTMGFVAMLGPENFCSAVMALKNSSTGAGLQFGFQFNSGASSTNILFINQMNTDGSFHAQIKAFNGWNNTTAPGCQGMMFLRVRDDGTNRYYSVGVEPNLTMQVYQEARTTWTTINSYGWLFDGSTNYPPCARILHWSVT